MLVEPVMDRLTQSREQFASTRRSLAELVGRYSTGELAVIADFLARNAERLRAETRKLDATFSSKRSS